ncbi:MAG: sugar ABC transporter ATP-binding protein [Frankia sp.]
MGAASTTRNSQPSLPRGPEAPGGPIALSARGLAKSYPGVRALRGVDIDLLGGQVHGLVGENGAGKSTLVNILTGVVAPDAGSMEAAGRRVSALDPRSARRLGIAAVHQEPNVVPALSPVANVFLGHSSTRYGMLRTADMRRRFLEWTDLLGISLPPDGAAGNMSLAVQQTIEIVRALEQRANVVFMDEPTSSLGPEERRALFRMIEVMTKRGVAIVFISHKLDDVIAVAPTITVLRGGQRVLTVRASETSPEALIEAMLGDSLAAIPAPRAPEPVGAPTIQVNGLSVPGVLRDIDIAIHAGEIVGVAGLVGSGRSTLLRAIGGCVASARGSLRIRGKPVRWPSTPHRARNLGVALAPEDRRSQGLVLGLSAAENLTLAVPVSRRRLGFYRRRELLSLARKTGARVGFAPDRVTAVARTLSGGNQQKLIIGRLIVAEPSLLLLDEPTRGIDVGAKAEIFRLVEAAGRKGMGVLIVSEDIEELVAIAHRVVVLASGAIVDSLVGEDITVERVLRRMLPRRSSEGVIA